VCIMNFKWFMIMHWWFIMRNTTKKCTYRYLNLLYYRLLHVSATYFGNFRKVFLSRYITQNVKIFVIQIILTFYVTYPSKNTSLKKATIGGRNI